MPTIICAGSCTRWRSPTTPIAPARPRPARPPHGAPRRRQYVQGRPRNELARQAVAALDSNAGEDRAFEIIAALGTLMWTVDRAALVFCVDQVEDVRFFSDAEERFQRAVRDIIQIANRLNNAIIIISCLEDLYGH